MSTDEQHRSARTRDDADQSQESIVASDAAVGSPAAEGDAEAQVPATSPDGPAASAETETLRRERDGLRDALLRRRAEFENFRRRTDRERQTWAAEAEATLVRELVPTLDNLDEALRTDTSEGGLREGVELIRRELLATLGRLGLTVHDPVGQPFNPLTDQALLHEEALDAAEDVVIETLRKGYLFKERLLRPAMVKVAKTASGPAEARGEDATSGPAANEVH